MAPLNLFICYRKKSSPKAQVLQFLLAQAGGFQPWMDEAELGAGMEWEAEIYRKILISDVLIVLIGIDTSLSDWVRREVALANALGISVVPLGTDLTSAEMVKELKALELDHIQGRITNNLKLPAGRVVDELRDDLIKAAERTRTNQKDTLSGLLSRQKVSYPEAPANQSVAVFPLPVNGGNIKIHVAAGDIAKIRGIDALVNSENDYMQMARFFESRTVSSTLRRLGAVTRGGKYDDIIQHELDGQLQGWPRPVQVGEAFATSAGGPHSELAKVAKARYLIHVASVQAVVAEARTIPFKQPYQIESCVRSVLAKIQQINQDQGIISPIGTEQRTEQEKRAAAGDGHIRSVIFPLFGTGQGGGECNDVIGPLFTGIQSYFEDPDSADLAKALTGIYISAFLQKDVDAVVAYLRARLDKP